MKQLFAAACLLVIVGIASFLYRNTVERPGVTLPKTACTLEAKICPDGSSVGREGLACEFPACPLPNVEIPDAGMSFVVPSGYEADENAYGADTRLVAAFTKPGSGAASHSIVMYRYEIPEGETGETVILSNSRYQPADELATDFARFTTRAIGNKTFRSTVIERFEGLVHSSYFLVRERDVLRFDIVEQDVAEWTNPGLEVDSLPEHQSLRTLLGSLQVTP